MQDGGHELDLLLVALGELLGAAVGEVLRAEPAQPVHRDAPGAVGRDAVQAAEELELLEDAHPRVQAALLGQVAPGRAREAVALDAAPGDPAGVGLEHAEGDPHRRRLARAVRAEESEHLALRDLEREVVEGHDAAEALEQVIDDEGHGRARDVMRPRA